MHTRNTHRLLSTLKDTLLFVDDGEELGVGAEPLRGAEDQVSIGVERVVK
jgi:hypothetical protein